VSFPFIPRRGCTMDNETNFTVSHNNNRKITIRLAAHLKLMINFVLRSSIRNVSLASRYIPIFADISINKKAFLGFPRPAEELRNSVCCYT
ncbi:hypothetical protein L9F63_010725, partial [Diploptera punctata]